MAAVGDPRTCPLMMIQIRGLGGAFADDSPAGGAVRPVPEPFQLLSIGVPAGARAGRGDPVRVRRDRRRARPARRGHRMPNFTGAGQDDAAGYDDARLARLQRDQAASATPKGVIRSNKPVLGA